ncbi:hypothetical protein SARC_00685 [Sphaeroforma arctica JP610]|uniref:Suppressor of forked domain-containing protein n=1 Tax=Sphaeroforma arctica JP610 TaxID=667725 RepID=A0A0L0GFZ7_9EUKA|nr:hypothetical protein SARC_00685 [Sphaeroforma arctica JP610]KNC87208.1 hypothetical protein SARC_00685 [Sphaeroforma arctica JP610]|eukprot:XP_014161110.1 hypothetical protein SARC_00685 [Sphaeroforma arctica JP610]
MAQLAAAAVKVIRALGIQLKANPYDYSAHISYIHALKEHEDRGGGVGGQDALEHARQHLRSVYPLSGTLWEEWISDTEVAQRASKSQPGEQRTDKIAGLYRCAFKDYLSVKLLLKYCKYMASKVNMTCTSTGNEEDAHNAANIGAVAAAREAYELALAHGGLHVSQGIHLWTSYVEFETAVCDMVEELEGGMNEGEGISNAPSGGQRVVVEQQNRVADVYKRALAIPLQGMEALRDMQQEWCDDNDRTADVNTTAEAYTRALTLREPLDALEGCLEAALQHEAKPKEATQDKAAEPVGASTGESSVAVYQRMIQHEIAYGDDPARVICVNERAIAANPLNIELWLAYTAYVERKLPTSTVLLDLCERSTRNCAWSSFLWQRRMRALERKNLAFHEIEGVFQAALLSGFPTPEEYVQLWLAFIDYQRRRIAWAELHAECDAAQDDSARERLREDTVYSLRETFQKASDYITVHFGKAVGDPYAQIPLGWARVELNGVQSVAHARAVLEAAAKDYPKNASVWLEYARFEMNETVFPACVAKVRKIYQTATEKTAGDYAVCQTWVQFERENGTLETYDSACARTEKAMEMARIRQEKHDEKERVKAQQQKEKAEIAQRATASKLADEQQTKEAKPAYTHEDVFAATEEHVVGAKGQKHTLDGTSEAVTDLKRQKTDTEEAVASSEKPAARVGTTVFLSNLSYQTAEQEITSLFDPDADASGVWLTLPCRGFAPYHSCGSDLIDIYWRSSFTSSRE